MYVPSSFDVSSDIPYCHRVIREFAFAQLITVGESGELFITSVPFLLDETRGPLGTLRGHLARANPQAKALSGGSALVTFNGPHTYISPSWYVAAPAVPTWNYVAVHAQGTARLLDAGETRATLDALVTRYEAGRDEPWSFADTSADYQEKMVLGIVAFDIEIAKLEGKAKLSQNRSTEDLEGVIHALSNSKHPGDNEVARCMTDRARAKRS
jgi:transcriptional regulator